jgi:hypothetical protein
MIVTLWLLIDYSGDRVSLETSEDRAAIVQL